ncbi:MAG: glycosyltransferase family 87 protein [Bacteroidota bacterium]
MNILNKLFPKEMLKGYGWFIAFLFFFTTAFFVMQLINNRFWMHDFEVYYSAATAFVHGDSVYGVPFGLTSGFYKYSPFTLLMYAPFCLVPFFVAKVIHLFILGTLLIVNIISIDKVINRTFFNAASSKRISLKMFLIFLPLLANVYTEMHLGNNNTVLLFLNVFALYQLLKGRKLWAGILFAIAILIKPHFLIFAPLFLLRKEYKCLFYTFSAVVVGLLIPIVFMGMQYNSQLLNQWVEIMKIHNNGLIYSPDTLYSWCYACFGQFMFSDVIKYDKIFGLAILILVSLGILTMIIFDFRKEKTQNPIKNYKERNFIFEFFILLAIIPNIVETDSEHFLFSIPLIAYIINFLYSKGELLFFKIIGISLLVLYGMNMRELIGKTLSAAYTAHGVFGLSNILIVSFCIFIHFKKQNQATPGAENCTV